MDNKEHPKHQHERSVLGTHLRPTLHISLIKQLANKQAVFRQFGRLKAPQNLLIAHFCSLAGGFNIFRIQTGVLPDATVYASHTKAVSFVSPGQVCYQGSQALQAVLRTSISRLWRCSF